MQENCKTAWTLCIQLIKEKINEQSFKTWFKPIIPKKIENNTLTIQVPSQFFYEWLEEHYVLLLRDTINKVLGSNYKLEYSIIVDKRNVKQRPFTVQLPAHNKLIQNAKQLDNYNSSSKNYKIINQQIYLNPNYTFESFIEGSCNKFVKSAAQAISKKLGKTSFNPFVIYGGVGLGKTHIVQALSNQIKNDFANKIVVYTSSEMFTTQFIEAVKSKNIQNFSQSYMSADLFVLDDVQFLAGKEKTQEIFFHIFNHLHQTGKQIVMTSDCPPANLQGLQERLISRFKWGLITELQKPTIETKIAIMNNKLVDDGLRIKTELIEYIANCVDTNIRELEGIIISLMAHASLNKQEINLELTKKVLESTVKITCPKIKTIKEMQEIISAHYNISVEQIIGASRKREIIIARQIAMYLSRSHTSHSLKSIGDHFGGKDHSTVVHSLKTVEDLLATDKVFQATFSDIKKKLGLL